MDVIDNELELIDLARQGDEESLNILFKKYSPVIRKIASSYYGVGYDHQDFFQEGRIAFVRSINTFVEGKGASFYSYSMTCVRNAITTAYRKLKSNAGQDYLVDDMEIINKNALHHSYSKRIDEVINDKMIIEEALSCDHLLSDLEKKCLRHLMLDNNYKEIAAILDISPKKVDNAIGRCKTKLKKRKYNK